MRDLEAAHRWGCPSPGYFDALPKDEKLDIIAWYEARWRMDAVDSWEAQQRAETAGRRRLRKR